MSLEDQKENSLSEGIILSIIPLGVIVICEYILLSKFNFQRDVSKLAEVKISWLVFGLTYPIIYLKLNSWRSTARYFVFIILTGLAIFGFNLASDSTFINKFDSIFAILLNVFVTQADYFYFTIFLFVASNLVIGTKFSFLMFLRVLFIGFVFKSFYVYFYFFQERRISITESMVYESIYLFVLSVCLLLESIKVQNSCKTRHLFYLQFFVVVFGIGGSCFWATYLDNYALEGQKRNAALNNYCDESNQHYKYFKSSEFCARTSP